MTQLFHKVTEYFFLKVSTDEYMYKTRKKTIPRSSFYNFW